MSHTLVTSGLAVTICLSTGKCLFCLNSASPANNIILNYRQFKYKRKGGSFSVSPFTW